MMKMKFLAVVHKELTLLARDPSGLLVLFLMPAILVVVITLVQEQVLQLTGQTATKVLYLDLDGGDVGAELAAQLRAAGLSVVRPAPDKTAGSAVQAAIADGRYRIGVIVPEGTSLRLHDEVQRRAERLLSRQPVGAGAAVDVAVFLDPGSLPSLRTGLTRQVEAGLLAVSLRQQLASIEMLLTGMLEPLGRSPGTTSEPASADLDAMLDQPLLRLDSEHLAGEAAAVTPYNPVQQNVPAWALFGIFFTAVPVAGGLLQERLSGIWTRLMSLPVMPLTFVAGKLFAYTLVCWSQYLLICLIGVVCFPLVGLPAFTLGAEPFSLLVVVVLTSIAACSFGVMLGCYCTSYEQASTLAATAVVVAAAIGGVMVPVYAMPPLMQRISIVSPLNWGLDAFYSLLVRGRPLSACAGDLLLLLLFGMVAIWLASRRLQINWHGRSRRFQTRADR